MQHCSKRLRRPHSSTDNGRLKVVLPRRSAGRPPVAAILTVTLERIKDEFAHCDPRPCSRGSVVDGASGCGAVAHHLPVERTECGAAKQGHRSMPELSATVYWSESHCRGAGAGSTELWTAGRAGQRSGTRCRCRRADRSDHRRCRQGRCNRCGSRYRSGRNGAPSSCPGDGCGNHPSATGAGFRRPCPISKGVRGVHGGARIRHQIGLLSSSSSRFRSCSAVSGASPQSSRTMTSVLASVAMSLGKRPSP